MVSLDTFVIEEGLNGKIINISNMSLDNIHLSSNENRKTQNLMFYPFSTSSNPNIGHDRFLGLPFKINKGTKCFSLVLKKNGNIEGHNIEDLLLYFKDNNINLNLIKGMVNEKVEKWIGTLTPPNTSKISVAPSLPTGNMIFLQNKA